MILQSIFASVSAFSKVDLKSLVASLFHLDSHSAGEFLLCVVCKKVERPNCSTTRNQLEKIQNPALLLKQIIVLLQLVLQYGSVLLKIYILYLHMKRKGDQKVFSHVVIVNISEEWIMDVTFSFSFFVVLSDFL